MKSFCLMVLSLLGLMPLAAQEGIHRYGMFIGANNGGPGREILRYAASDAQAMVSVLQELGGLPPGNSQSLINPTRIGVISSFKTFQLKIAAMESQTKRSEFIFYYSGHSDEEGLLIGNERITYGELRTYLNQLKADVKLAILDSCSSGAFTRLKGGKRSAPFMVDESTDLKGHAYLTSSSETEASQESDRIGGSFFTHYLISGLRGAADTTGDSRVTLNEVYHHAFKETLEKTEKTQAGPQHPSYDIQLSGTGDLILTDLMTQNSRLVFDQDLEGRIFVRTLQGQLVAEFQKNPIEAKSLALSAGQYGISVQNAQGYSTAKVQLNQGDQRTISHKTLTPTYRESNRSRGTSQGTGEMPPSGSEEVQVAQDPDPDLNNSDSKDIVIRLPNWEKFKLPFLPFFNPEDPSEEQLPSTMESHWFNIGLVPGLELFQGLNKQVKASFHSLIGQSAETQGFMGAGLLGITGKLLGGQISGLGNIDSGSLRGFQGSGIFNIGMGRVFGAQVGGIFNLAGEDLSGFQGAGISNLGQQVNGFQAAGIFNKSSSLNGFQAAGIINISGDVTGLQAGLINKANNVKGLQIGLINIADDVTGLSLGLITISKNATYRLHLTYDTQHQYWANLQWGLGSFYHVAFFGKPQGDLTDLHSTMTLGYGLGFKWGKEWSGSLDVSSKFLTGGTLVNEWSWTPGIRLASNWNWGPVGFSMGAQAHIFHSEWNNQNQLNSTGLILSWESPQGTLQAGTSLFWSLNVGF